VSIGNSETTDPNINNSSVSNEVEETSSQLSKTGTKSRDGKKKDITGFTAEGVSNDLVYTRTFKKVKKDDEHWVQVQAEKRKLYHFVRDEEKYQRLMSELKNNTSIHPEFKIPIKTIFETPKINVVEITYLPNSPFIVHKSLNLKNPIPMFIVDRETTTNPDMLGGIASYILAGKDSGTPSVVVENSKVIGVMKVILASDKEITVENIVFNDKPANPDMVPVLEDVKTPDIPLLKNAKFLKWKCNRCLATTWKFPLHKESHFCNACPICHKTFISPVSLKKHLVVSIEFS
jgi:ribosomal protein S27E